VPVSNRSSWGIHSLFNPVTSVVAGVNTVIRNVGVAIQISGQVVRLTKLGWRVDIAPDVVAGTVVGPTTWRVVVFNAPLPQDVGLLQQQAFAAGARPEIPNAVSGVGSPLAILHDEWLDFSKGSPGLNGLGTREFPDAGPTVTDFLTVLLCPILDAQQSQAIVGAANAMMTIEAYGTAADGGAFGGAIGSGAPTSPSLSRYDIPVSRSQQHGGG
jgi:hypothetical protein